MHAWPSAHLVSVSVSVTGLLAESCLSVYLVLVSSLLPVGLGDYLAVSAVCLSSCTADSVSAVISCPRVQLVWCLQVSRCQCCEFVLVYNWFGVGGYLVSSCITGSVLAVISCPRV